jgi:RNA polymerase sigma factor (sigma-70 family)
MTAQHFTAMVDIYSDKIFRYILKHGIRQTEAEDMVQNCFEALWRSKMNTDEECGKYLFGVAYNKCADYWRKSKREILVEHLPEKIVEKNTENNTLQKILHQLLLQMPTMQRSLILLKDYEGYSYEEIASITHLNISQVKVYLHRARLQLQQKIGTLQNII